MGELHQEMAQDAPEDGAALPVPTDVLAAVIRSAQCSLDSRALLRLSIPGTATHLESRPGREFAPFLAGGKR